MMSYSELDEAASFGIKAPKLLPIVRYHIDCRPQFDFTYRQSP
jgi:hypothetical protein